MHRAVIVDFNFSGMNECPEMSEHFNDHKYRSNQNCQEPKKHIQQISHWDVIKVVFHVRSFLAASVENLNSSVERVFSLSIAYAVPAGRSQYFPAARGR